MRVVLVQVEAYYIDWSEHKTATFKVTFNVNPLIGCFQKLETKSKVV